jgi:hypothetical protein
MVCLSGGKEISPTYVSPSYSTNALRKKQIDAFPYLQIEFMPIIESGTADRFFIYVKSYRLNNMKRCSSIYT